MDISADKPINRCYLETGLSNEFALADINSPWQFRIYRDGTSDFFSFQNSPWKVFLAE